MAKKIRRPTDAVFALVTLAFRTNRRTMETVRRSINRRLVNAQKERVIDYLDSNAALVANQEEFLAKALGTSAAMPNENIPLERITSTSVVSRQGVGRGSKGNIQLNTPVSKVTRVSNQEAFLSARDRALLAQQRELETLHKKAIARSLKETELARQRASAALRNYVWLVSKAFMVNGTMQSSKELLKILAGASAMIDAVTIKAFANGLKKQYNEVSRLQVYINAMARIQRQRVGLYIKDSALLQANNNMTNILKAVSFQMAKGIEILIYESMVEAFEQAWSGLTPEQWPTQYKGLVYNIIQHARETHAVKMTGNLVTNWAITADFGEIFGNKADFQRGFHYKAIIGSKGFDYKRGGSYSPLFPNVKLPYGGAKLKNPTNIRYAFWYAMWMNYKFLSPTMGYSDTTGSWEASRARARKAHFDTTSKRLDRLQKRKQTLLDEQEDRRQQQVRAAFKRAQSPESDRWERNQYKNVFDESSKEIQEIDKKIAYVDTGVAYSSKHRYSEPRAIKNAAGLRAGTISARVKYWMSINKAPVWVLLEYGQLAYAPRIPPRGVYVRFISILQKKVKELLRKAQNEQASKYYGYTVDPGGAKRVAAPQEGGDYIQFWIGGGSSQFGPGIPDERMLKTGEVIPESNAAFRKFVIAHKVVTNTIAEATRIGADTTAARILTSQAKQEVEQSMAAAKAVTGKIKGIKTGETHYYPRSSLSGAGASLRGKTAMFRQSPAASVAGFQAILDAPRISGASLIPRKSSRISSTPSYTPVYGGGIFTPEEAKSYLELPNKGLQRIALNRKMRQRGKGHYRQIP